MEESRKEMIEQQMPKSCSIDNTSVSPLKKGIVDFTEQLQEDFYSPTPVKKKEPSRISNKKEIAELPEKLADLLEFFECMTSSLRLLHLRKQKPYFQNVRAQVERLTKSNFLAMHLAQIKYILPEAIKVDKVLVHDEKTKSMIPDIEITLLTKVVKDHGEESLFMALSNLFSSKLRKYCISHPEDTDVPEAELPEPFNQRISTIKEDTTSKDLSTLFEAETLRVQDTNVPEAELSDSETKILNASHFSPTFRRHFCEKSISIEMEKTNLPSDATFASLTDEELEELKAPNSSSETGNIEATPVKIPLISDSDIIATPVQSTPMRSMSPSKLALTCEDDKKSVSQDIKLSTSAVKKSLYFYGKAMEGEDTIISQKQSTVSLSSLVPLIHQIFKSVNFCPITKEELVHKIIMHNLEIDDRGEVETQMEHLEKLVPDWFFKKLAASGDLLYSVTKVSDLNSVCEKVEVI